jgi:hypothetical protein
MDIVLFWKKQVDLWNENQKCNLCWEFSAPLVNSQINIVQNEKCCVNVFLTDLKFREVKDYNQITGLVAKIRCVWNVTVHFLVRENLGVNNYNEIKGYPIEESKWENIFKPIIDCVGCGNILDTCEISGHSNLKIEMGSDAVLVHNYLDENYNGWRVNYLFTQIK